MGYKAVYVCRNCKKVYNTEDWLALPCVCKRCGATMKNLFGFNQENVLWIKAKRKILGWEITGFSDGEKEEKRQKCPFYGGAKSVNYDEY